MFLDVDNGMTVRLRDISAVSQPETLYGTTGPYDTDYSKVLGYMMSFQMVGGQTFKKMYGPTADIESERQKLLESLRANP